MPINPKKFAFVFQLAGLALVAPMCFALHCLLVSSQAPEYRLDSKPGLVKNSHHIHHKKFSHVHVFSNELALIRNM